MWRHSETLRSVDCFLLEKPKGRNVARQENSHVLTYISGLAWKCSWPSSLSTQTDTEHVAWEKMPRACLFQQLSWSWRLLRPCNWSRLSVDHLQFCQNSAGRFSVEVPLYSGWTENLPAEKNEKEHQTFWQKSRNCRKTLESLQNSIIFRNTPSDNGHLLKLATEKAFLIV